MRCLKGYRDSGFQDPGYRCQEQRQERGCSSRVSAGLGGNGSAGSPPSLGAGVRTVCTVRPVMQEGGRLEGGGGQGVFTCGTASLCAGVLIILCYHPNLTTLCRLGRFSKIKAAILTLTNK